MKQLALYVIGGIAVAALIAVFVLWIAGILEPLYGGGP